MALMFADSVSGRLPLLVTALAALLCFGCGEGVQDETGSATLGQLEETSPGDCNSTVAVAMQAAQICARSGCSFGSNECADVQAAFLGFFTDPVCAAAFDAGELEGLPGNASLDAEGQLKHVGDVICSSVVQCGLCGAGPPGVCGGPCGE